jgi:hypothetical protein
VEKRRPSWGLKWWRAGEFAAEVQEVREKVQGIVRQQGFLKKSLASKDADVRRAAYTLMATLTQRCVPQETLAMGALGLLLRGKP